VHGRLVVIYLLCFEYASSDFSIIGVMADCCTLHIYLNKLCFECASSDFKVICHIDTTTDLYRSVVFFVAD
jgi:hypothetical protein